MTLVITELATLQRWCQTRWGDELSEATKSAWDHLLAVGATARGLKMGDDWGPYLEEFALWLHTWQTRVMTADRVPAVLVDVVEREPPVATAATHTPVDGQPIGGSPPELPADLPPRPWKLMTLWQRPELLPHVTADELSRMVSQVVEVMRAGVRAADHIDTAYDPSF